MMRSSLQLQSYKEAIESFDATLRLDPRNVKALFRKGKVLLIESSACITMLRHDEHNMAQSCLTNLHQALLELKEYEASIEWLRKARDVDGDDKVSMFHLLCFLTITLALPGHCRGAEARRRRQP